MSIVFQQKCRNEVLHEMKYSPCGEYLAVGSNENFVDVFKTKPNYKRLGSCSGKNIFFY
jgi:microtubule-associated protein-like 6